MSATGPVEQGSGADEDPWGEPANAPGEGRPGDILDTTRRTAHPRGRLARRALLAAGILTLIVFAIANVLRQQDRRDPAPGPGGIRTITYRGLTVPTDHTDPTFTVHLRVTAAPGPAATVTDIRHPFAGLTTRSSPAAPFSVSEHRPRNVALAITVRDCNAAPLDLRLPFLDVTLRKGNVMTKHTDVLDRSYATDVTGALRTICRRQQHGKPKPLIGTGRSHDVNTEPPDGNTRSVHTAHRRVAARHNKKVTA